MNSQNFSFLFKGRQLIAWLGQKTKLKLLWTFSSFNFQFFFFFFFLSSLPQFVNDAELVI